MHALWVSDSEPLDRALGMSQIKYEIPGLTLLTMQPIAVRTDGGPWAEHNMPCPVCKENKAMMDIDGWVFNPCAPCYGEGWMLMRLQTPLVRRFVNWLSKS